MLQEKTIEELKLEISGYYVKELQKEFGWLKGLVLLPIKKEIKNIIVNEKELPDKFNKIKEFGRRKDIINFVTPSIAEQIFNFIKEKKEEIAKKNTKDELITLKNEILGKLKEEDKEEDKEDSTDSQPTQESKEGQGEQDNADGNEEDQKEKENNTDKPSSSTVGIVTGSSGAVAVKVGEKSYIKLKNRKEVKEISEKLSGRQMKESVSAILDSAEKQKKALSGQLSKKQRANINKQIRNIRSMLNDSDFTDEGVLAFMARQRLGDDLPEKMLDKMGHNVKNIGKLSSIANEIAAIDDIEELKKLLKTHNITGLDDEFLKLLVKTNRVEDITGIIRIAGNASKAKNIAKTIGGALVLDVAFFGVDIWTYLESKKEAELIEKVNAIRADNKYKQANCQLVIGAGSVLAEAIIARACLGSMTGPVGTALGIAVGVLFGAISIGVDSLYFDVQDFYLQNKEDFIRQKKSELNQAILQGLYNKTHGNTTINEFIGAPDASQKIKSTNDALWAAIFLDEIENGKYRGDNELYAYVQSGKSLSDYKSSIDGDEKKKDAFQKSRARINEEIKKRMEYCTNKESGIVENIKKGKGMKTLDDIIVHSRVYAHISENDKRDNTKDYQTNLQAYKQEFFKDVDQYKLKKLEDLRISNKELFEEVIATTDKESLIGADEESENGESKEGDGTEKIPSEWENMKNEYLILKSYVNVVVKYKEWLKITQPNAEKIKLNVPNLSQHKQYIETLFTSDLKTDTLLNPGFEGKDGAILRFNQGLERNGTLEVSDDPLYNVLYRLGKELYGYTGNNEKSELMGFYDENLGNNHGIYYSEKRKINDDRAYDSGLIDNGMKGPFNSQDEVNKFVENFLKKNLYVQDPETGEYVSKSTIDTKTENIDSQLQKEFEDKLREVMKEELSYRIKDNVDSVKNEIITFVKNSYSEYNESNEDDLSYITLPYYLIIKAKRAGLGDMQKALFKRRKKEGKMEICRLPYDTFNIAIPFDNDKVIMSYISSYRDLQNDDNSYLEGNDMFTEEEKFFIDRVERAHQLVEDLRSCESGGSKEDEIDFPTEVEHLISDKYNERLRFKRNLMIRDSGYVSVKTIQEYEEFATYFENLYRGILLMLTTFKVSNDLDSYSLYAAAINKGSQVYFDDKGQLKTDTDLEFINLEENRKFYAEQLKIQKVKVRDKEMTIQQLWDMKSPTEDSKMTEKEYEENKALALQASNIMLTVLLEKSMLTKDKNGKVHNIKIGGHWRDSDKNDAVDGEKAKQETQALIQERLKLLKIPPRNIDKDQIKKSRKSQDIIRITEQEKKTISTSIEITKLIEETQKNIDRQGKRGKISYDPDKQIISSWDNEIQIEVKEKDGKKIFYMSHLSIGFEKVEDFIWMANFRNWVLYENKTNNYNKPISFIKDPDLNSIFSKKTFVRGTTTLIERDDLIKHCSICDSDDNMRILSIRLTNEINGDYEGLKFEGGKVVA